MTLADEYLRQYRWRAWPRVYAVLPDLRDQTVLDIGCGVGDQAADLAARGAKVTGIDVNDELIARARSRHARGLRCRSPASRTYDFYTGRKLQSCLEAAGFQVNVVMLKSSKRGVGASIVWSLLRDQCGPEVLLHRYEDEWLGVTHSSSCAQLVYAA